MVKMKFTIVKKFQELSLSNKSLLIFSGIILILAFTVNLNKSTTPPQPAPQPNETNSSPATHTLKKIPYKIVDKWDIPSPRGRQIGITDRIGMRIVISPKYLNMADMTDLGETLVNDAQNYQFAYIQIHTSKKSALIQKRLSTATMAEGNYLGRHLVGSYIKNNYSGFHEFNIFLKGADDTSPENNKVIKY